jgi:AcrR family transcriptional regulator
MIVLFEANARVSKKIDKREAILEAMLDLVVKRGFHDAPMSVLARRSGASPGVIYHYFASKDALIRAVYEHVERIKHEAFFKGYSERMSAREALLHIWLNAYDFYRTHTKEARFLEQYLNSPYCKTAGGDEKDAKDPTMKRIIKWMRPKKHGGILRDLPAEAIDSLTLGLAASLAKSSTEFSRPTLRSIAETVWTAIAEE